MAKQVGPIFFTGTIDGLIFYKLGDNYYMRSKGSYKSARHMRRNPRYQRTLQQADRFGSASQLVKEVYYRHLPRAVRKHGLFGKLTGMVNRWLYAGKAEAEVKELLIAHCQKLAAAVTMPAKFKAKAITPEQPTPTTKRPTITAQPSPVNEQCPTDRRGKQARYLSRWKVNGMGAYTYPGG